MEVAAFVQTEQLWFILCQFWICFEAVLLELRPFLSAFVQDICTGQKILKYNSYRRRRKHKTSPDDPSSRKEGAKTPG